LLVAGEAATGSGELVGAGRGPRARERSRANGTSYVLWWFFALSRNRTRHAREDAGWTPTRHPSACHGASAWGCETTTGLRSCRFSLSISPSI
jgi:hypothetical protein